MKTKQWLVLLLVPPLLAVGGTAWAGGHYGASDRGMDAVEELAAVELQTVRTRAEGGEPPAQLELGLRYRFGWGVDQSDTEAAAWYRRAAEQGHSGAMAALAGLHQHGKGVDRDPVRALAWFIRAAEANVAVAVRARDGLMAELSDEQVSEAERLARAGS